MIHDLSNLGEFAVICVILWVVNRIRIILLRPYFKEADKAAEMSVATSTVTYSTGQGFVYNPPETEEELTLEKTKELRKRNNE